MACSSVDWSSCWPACGLYVPSNLLCFALVFTYGLFGGLIQLLAGMWAVRPLPLALLLPTRVYCSWGVGLGMWAVLPMHIAVLHAQGSPFSVSWLAVPYDSGVTLGLLCLQHQFLDAKWFVLCRSGLATLSQAQHSALMVVSGWAMVCMVF